MGNVNVHTNNNWIAKHSQTEKKVTVTTPKKLPGIPVEDVPPTSPKDDPIIQPQDDPEIQPADIPPPPQSDECVVPTVEIISTPSKNQLLILHPSSKPNDDLSKPSCVVQSMHSQGT